MNNVFPLIGQFAPLISYLDKVDAVWFDLDGTLVDNEGDALDLIRQIISDEIISVAGGDHPGITECYRHLAGKKIDEIIAIAQNDTDMDLEQATIDKIKERIKAARCDAHKSIINPEVVRPIAAFAQFVKEQGKPICVVTASEYDRALLYIQASGLNRIFTAHPDTWLFASNLQDKTETHIATRDTMSLIHGFEIDPRLWVGFEDSPGAVAAAVRADSVVIPHTLSTHISETHIPARHSALKQAKIKTLHETGGYEWVAAADGTTRRVSDMRDIHVIRTPSDFVSVVLRTLKALPARNTHIHLATKEIKSLHQ